MVEKKEELKLPIGGFFPLEEVEKRTAKLLPIHSNAIGFGSGRVCMKVLLDTIQPKKIFLPFYYCDVVLQAINFAETIIEFYAINENFEPILPKGFSLKESDYFLYINYFDLNRKNASALYARFKEKLILDNSQAFFETGKIADHSFNSARKFFGVSDGGFCYSTIRNSFAIDLLDEIEADKTHLLELKNGNREIAFRLYHEAEEKFDARVSRISNFSLSILKKINFAEVSSKRVHNFRILHNGLKDFNKLKINLGEGIPFAYPFLPIKSINRDILIEKEIFFPRLWPNVLEIMSENNRFERELTKDLLPLPVDHRWGEQEMKYIVNEIRKLF